MIEEDTFKKYKEEHESTDYIKVEDCIKSGLYRIHCRNFSFGIFNGKTGFIGIREKFDQKYLFTEYHWDTDKSFGTVKPFELIDNLPADIICSEFIEHEKGSDWAINPKTNELEPVIRRYILEGEAKHGNRHGFEDIWVKTGERLPDKLYPTLIQNDKLYNWLESKIKE